jgi:hypothetical protein
MPVNLNQLYPKLLEASKQGPLVLGGAEFPDESSARCLSNLLPTGSVSVHQAAVSYDQAKGAIRISGTCAEIYGEKNASVTALICAQPGNDGEIGLLVNSDLSSGRSLAEPFRDQIAAAAPDGGQPGSILSGIQLQRATLILSSFPQVQGQAAASLFNELISGKAAAAQVPALHYGANIVGLARLDTNLLGVTKKAEDTTYSVLATVSAERPGEPVLCRVPVSQTLDIGAVRLALSDLQLSVNRRGGVSIGPSEKVNVAGSISLGKQSFSMVGAFLPRTGVLSFSLKDGGGATIDVDALANMLLGRSVKSLIPIGPDTLKLALDHFGMQLALWDARLVHAGLGLSVAGDLELVPGKVSVRQPALALAVENPLDPRSRRLDLALSGELMVDEHRVVLSARAPRFDIYGELADGGEIPVGAIFKHFGVVSPLFESMVLSNLSLITFDGNQGFQVGGRLSAAWKVQLFGMSFEYRSIDLALQYFSGAFGLSFDCACTFSGVDYAVSGRINTSGQGLSFSASSGPGQIVALGALVKDIVAPFGVELPPQVSTVRLSDIELSLDGNSGSVDISARQVPGDVWPIDIGGRKTQVKEMSLRAGVTDAATRPSVYGQLKGWLEVSGNEIEVFFEFRKELNFKAYIPGQPLTKLLGQFVDLKNVPVPDVVLGDTVLSASPGEGLRFTSSLSADFHDLAAQLKIPLPDGLARVDLSLLEMRVGPKAGNWSLKIATPTSIQLPGGSANHLDVSGIQIELKHEGETTIGCDFTVGGKVAVTPDLQIDSSGLKCSWQSGKAGHWNVDGTVTVTVGKTAYPFIAVIDVAGDHSRFGLQYKKPLTLVSWTDVQSSVTADKLTVGVEKSGDRDTYTWSLTGNTHFRLIDKLITADGTLSLKGGQLEITATVAKPPKIALPLQPSPTIDLKPQPLRLILGSGEQQGPVIEAGTTVTLRDIPAPADKVFPARPMAGSLRVDSKGFAITFKPPGDPTIDVTFAKGTPMQVRFPKIDIKTFFLDRIKVESKAVWRLGAELHVEKLSQLNKLFGGADLFVDRVDLLLSLASGLSIAFKTSPFKAIALRTLPDKTVWTEWVEILDIGTFSFRVPDFAFDFAGGRWHAAGGIETRGELAIPLTPIKWLFGKCGFPKGVLKAMPAAIPLIELHLDSPEFYKQLTRMIGAADKNAQSAFKKLADLLQKGAKRIPEHFEDYLDLYIPKGFTFDIAVEPTGGFSFGINVKDAKPLKALMPAMVGVPPLPGLMGITMYRVAFGLSGGGSIGLLKVDGWLDQIDAISLIFALTTGQGKAISNRFIMRDTTALIPMAAPLPIPLFYKQVGWEYRDLFGIGMQFHASFPDPQPSLMDWVALIGGLVKFFSQKKYFLHDKGNLPAAMALDFTLQPTTLSLPSYLGGVTLGPTRNLPALSVSDTLARALDGIKAGNLGWVIQAVPLKYSKSGKTAWIRVGREKIVFGPLQFTVGWCVTTEDEFRNQVLPSPQAKKALGVANADQMLESLPKNQGGTSYDKGFVVLLMGEIAARTALADIFAFRCQFGMALLGPKDFETGVRLVGSFGPKNMLALGIEGRIRVEPPSTVNGTEIITVGGKIYLIVLGKELALAGRLVVEPGKSFQADIGLTLTPQVKIVGTLRVDANGVAIIGHVAWMGIGSSSGQFATRTVFSKQGILFEPFDVTLGGFGCRASLRLPGSGKGSFFTVGVGVKLPKSFFNDFKAGLKDTANEIVGSEINKAFGDLENAIIAQKGFEASLRGLQSWLPGLCQGIINAINDATTKKSVHGYMDRWAGKNLFKKGAVAVAKLGAPEKVARNSAAPWIRKLTAVRDAARRPLDKNYQGRLQKALRDLRQSNVVIVRIGRIGKFPGIQVYKHSPVLNGQQIKLIDAAIIAIGELPKVSRTRVGAESILKRFPKKQVIMAQVREDINKGVDSAVPTVESVGFEYSAGRLTLTNVTLVTVFTFNQKRIQKSVTADLTRPDKTAKALARAFADAF